MDRSRAFVLLAAMSVSAVAVIAQARSVRPRHLELTPAAQAAIGPLQDAAAREQSSDDERVRITAFEQLADGLEHTEWSVRLRAVELLSVARARDRAVDRLVIAAAQIGAELEKRRRALPAPEPEAPPDLGGDLAAGMAKALQQANASLVWAKQWMDAMDDAVALAEAHRHVFLAMPAAAQRRGLLALHRSFPAYDPEWLPALLALCDADVIDALGDIHAATSTSVMQAKDALGKTKRQKARRNPWPEKRKDAWLARERERIDQELAQSQKQYEERNGSLVEFEDSVARFAKQQGLPAPPKGAANASWRSWANAARKVVAERAPK